MKSPPQRPVSVLVEEYVPNAGFGAARARLGAIDEAGESRLRFSWRCGTDPDGRFYYRVHGPRILIEYAQRPNHVRTIMRDPANDYGANWLGDVITGL